MSRSLACLLFAFAVLLALPAPASAAPAAAHVTPTPTPDRPAQPVAYARIALVRVLTYYNGMTSNSGPVPIATACAADGALVGTTGNGLNSYNYVLLPTSTVDPITPCEGVQAAFQDLYGNASGWSINRISAVLAGAYTGTGTQQLGSITYSIDPAQVTTNGGPSGPQLLALPLAPATGAPGHDLPVLALPQPSDAPAGPVKTVLDLAGATGAPLGRDSLNPEEINSTLYPIDLPAAQLSQVAPAPTAPPSPNNSTGGTVVPAGSSPTATSSAASTLAARISVGAPVIDSNGRLVGMVIDDGNGNHVVAQQSMLAAAINQISGGAGPLMSAWQQGLTAFYSAPPAYTQASAAFTKLRSADPDFAGVVPFATAAQHQTADIPALTHAASANGPTGGGGTPPATVSHKLIYGAIAVGVLAVLLALALVLLLVRRARRAGPKGPPPEEEGLDLLPRESMYDLPAITEATTQHLPSIGNGHSRATDGHALEEMPTATLAAVRQPTPSVARPGTMLMALAAGVTDAGIRRAAEPNQDNILALNGMRVVGNRPQPFGFFIVADGMGGHEHGQEASRLAIEILMRTVTPALAGQQPLDGGMLAALLNDGLQRAHAELRGRNATHHADMGTTITAALILDDFACVANIGDSRTYLMNPDSGLRQITIDHSVVASLVAAGVIRADEIYTHPRRNQIYRSLGGDGQSVELDTFTVSLQAGDKLLLCSDGLWEMVRDPQIEHILRAAADPRQAAELLVREANANGGEDNISALVVRMVEEMPQHAQPGMQVIVGPQSA